MNDINVDKLGACILKWTLVTIVALIAAFTLTGCNTVKGFGKDLTSVAQGIQDEMGTDSSSDDSSSR